MHPVPGSESSTAAEADREVNEWLQAYFSAIERRDLQAFLSCFEACDAFTVVEDGATYGWREFAAFVERVFGFVVKVRLDVERCAVDACAPDVAVATGVFRGVGEDAAGNPVKVHSAFTFVLCRVGGDWKIRHVHESAMA